MHLSSTNHIIHLPSYRKHPGIFKIKLIVLAEEKMMHISEEFKHVLTL